MPMKSQAQRAYLHIHHPRIADRWEAHTPKGKKLPEHVPGSPDAEKHSAFYGHGVAQAMLDIGMVEKQAKVITPERRAHMAKSTFAQPNKTEEGHKGKYPIPDKRHAAIALGFAKMHHDSGAMKAVKAKVKAKYPGMLDKKAESIIIAAEFLKQAWPWSGGQGTSTVAQNYHPDTVTRARDVEQGRVPSVARPNLPPQIIQGTPAPAAPATPPPSGDPLKGAIGQQRNLLALNAQNWR